MDEVLDRILRNGSSRGSFRAGALAAASRFHRRRDRRWMPGRSRTASFTDIRSGAIGEQTSNSWLPDAKGPELGLPYCQRGSRRVGRPACSAHRQIGEGLGCGHGSNSQVGESDELEDAVSFRAYIEDLPMLHSWDGGKTWNSGGFSASQLKAVHGLIGAHFARRPVRVLETGAGNSTITFLHLDLDRLISIAPSADLRERILGYCTEHGIDTSRLDYRLERSEIELPRIALGSDPPVLDVALIDGGHGWPTVFVDFCYVNMMMKSGSLIFLDDVQIYAVAELSRLLEMQPGFALRDELGKLQVWEKEDDRRFLPEHSREPYIIKMTRRANERR